MKFKAKTQEQIDKENLIPKGIYDFQVIFAEDTVSKTSGADMIKIGVNLYEKGEKISFLYDYLMGGKMQFKLLHFCQAGGLEEKYGDGELTAEDCMNVIGKCKVGTKAASDGYPAKSVIQDYVADDTAPYIAGCNENGVIEDDIPY